MCILITINTVPSAYPTFSYPTICVVFLAKKYTKLYILLVFVVKGFHCQYQAGEDPDF